MSKYCKNCKELTDQLAAAQDELDLVRGAMRADDERLATAAGRVGIPMSCDAADEMADKLLWVRAQLARLRAIVGRLEDDGLRTTAALAAVMSKETDPLDAINLYRTAVLGKEDKP